MKNNTEHTPTLPGLQCPWCSGPVVDAPYSNCKCAAKCQGRRERGIRRTSARFAYLEQLNAELLEALETVLDLYDQVYKQGLAPRSALADMAPAARAAIAKAKGER